MVWILYQICEDIQTKTLLSKKPIAILLADETGKVQTYAAKPKPLLKRLWERWAPLIGLVLGIALGVIVGKAM